MTKLNPKIAEAMGMKIPEEEEQDTKMTIAPHELPAPVKNPNLPDMEDIDYSLLEGEKQLEETISMGLTSFKEMERIRPSIEPQYSSRFIEVGNDRLKITIEAIKAKIETQHKKKDTRLKEANFVSNDKHKPETQNNFFFGSREELMEMIGNYSSGNSAPEEKPIVDVEEET